MNQIFDSLAALPGVRVCGLITEDGVPVALPGKPAEDGREFDIDAIAAIASQWFNEVSRELGAASWASPQTTELTAQHGSLVLMAVPRGVLVCLADRGLAVEEIRLSLSGAAARIQRQLRSMAPSSSSVAGNSATDPPAPLPKQGQDPAGETFAGGGDPGSHAQSS